MYMNLHAVLCMLIELRVSASDNLRMYVVNIEEKDKQLLAATKLNSDLQTTINLLQVDNAALKATIDMMQADMSRLNSTINARKFNSE